MSIKDKDLNPETQLRELREHAAELYGAVLVSEFIDKASANDLRGRRRWRELLIARQHSQLDLIVVWRLDRAFRSILNCATTLGRPRAWGCGRRRLQEPCVPAPDLEVDDRPELVERSTPVPPTAERSATGPDWYTVRVRTAGGSATAARRGG